MKYITTIGDREFNIEILDERHVSINGKVYTVDYESIEDQPLVSLLVDSQSYEAFVYPNEDEWQVMVRGRLFPVTVEDERSKRLKAAKMDSGAGKGEFHLKAPMPGLVISVPVGEGQAVKRGDVLVVLESMKMQNELKSPQDGVVARLRVKEGDRVEQRQTLLSVLPEAAA